MFRCPQSDPERALRGSITGPSRSVTRRLPGASPAISRALGRELAYCTRRFVLFRLVCPGADGAAGSRPPISASTNQGVSLSQELANQETEFNCCHFSIFSGE